MSQGFDFSEWQQQTIHSCKHKQAMSADRMHCRFIFADAMRRVK